MPDKLSKQQKLDLIADMIRNNNRLCPQIFTPEAELLPPVRQKLNEFSNFIQKMALAHFTNVKIIDVILSGSICSYIYNDRTDVDFFIIVSDIFPEDLKLNHVILNKTNQFINSLNCKPYFFSHPLDYGILHFTNEKTKAHTCYSLLNNNWKNLPVRREFTFSAQELYDSYCAYSANLHQFASSLKKINNAFLEPAEAQKLQDYLQTLRNKAYLAKETSPEQEYSLDYNLYRLLKKFGTYNHFQDFAAVSYKNALRKNA